MSLVRTDSDIQTAVTAWLSGDTSTYGDISDWDTSAVTDMSSLFRNNINFISGYDNNYRFTNFFGWGFEYELPLFYPDFSIGPIAYIQRVRGTGFINGGTIEGNLNNGGTTFTESPKSAGVGITLDLNLFRQAFMFDLGVKYSYVFGFSDFEKGQSIEITLVSITF